MTYPAIVRNLSVPVALHTKAHLERLFHYDAVHLGDIAVAFAAIDARLNMTLMTEICKLLQNIYSNPLDGNFIVIMLP